MSHTTLRWLQTAGIMKDNEAGTIRISLIDRSLYYKGLMLLVRKDRAVHDNEKKMMMNIGKMLGFETKFCADRIEEIIDNKHIIDLPPLFSETNIALCFIRDGLRLSASDGQLHKDEITWLESVAESNGLSHLWAGELDKFHLVYRSENSENSLELLNFIWE